MRQQEIKTGSNKFLKMAAELAAPAQRKRVWQRAPLPEKMVVLGIIIMFFPLIVFLSGQQKFIPFPFRISMNITGLYSGLDQTSNNYMKGLISNYFSKTSCLSRYEAALFYKTSPHVPSSYLVQKLRNYEALHKKCGPNTPLYQKSIKQLISGQSSELIECNYVVWIPYNGLGNRILSLASTFLYAVLTNRVMLIQQTKELEGLFCEPFPDTSWILPPNFPIKKLHQFNVNSNVTYGNMLDKHVISTNYPKTMIGSLPSYVYIHIIEDYQDLDKLFFCNDDQMVLGNVNWLLLKSDLYFVPSMYSIPLFEEELNRLFPSKASTFYLLAHYLIHPSNAVWELVRNYHSSYLATADVKIGVQVRVFHFTKVSSNVIFQQILNCSKMESVLPGFGLNETTTFKNHKPKTKTILVVSLSAEYSERFKAIYYDHLVKTGEFVNVHQPSHEEIQNTEDTLHNQKALAEIYLLSLSDVLMTSGWSTFGYVSSGLAGKKPAILMPIWDQNIPDLPCVKAISMEPCHLSPPRPTCKGNTISNIKLGQYVKQCPDDIYGIKLFD